MLNMYVLGKKLSKKMLNAYSSQKTIKVILNVYVVSKKLAKSC